MAGLASTTAVWYSLGGILASRGKAYQRSSGDSAAKKTAKASSTRLALRRMAGCPSLGAQGCSGTVVSSGLGEVLPLGTPMAVTVKTRARAAASPIAAAARARMSQPPVAAAYESSDGASGLGHRSN